MAKQFITKDSGARQDYASGMRRDLQEGKPNFNLITPKFLKFDEDMLYRWAMLMTRGADKYGERNWEKANSDEEMERFKSSAFRHFMQWIKGEEDEDHAAAVFFNIGCFESIKMKVDKAKEIIEKHPIGLEPYTEIEEKNKKESKQ